MLLAQPCGRRFPRKMSQSHLQSLQTQNFFGKPVELHIPSSDVFSSTSGSLGLLGSFNMILIHMDKDMPLARASFFQPSAISGGTRKRTITLIEQKCSDEYQKIKREPSLIN